MQSIGAKIKAIPGSYWRLSSIEFTYRFTWACTSFLTLFLQSQGLNASKIGLVNALCSAVAIVASPVWGVVSDRLRSVRRVFLLVMGLLAVCWALIPPAFRTTVLGVNLGLVMIALASFFNQPSGALVDSWMVQSANREKLQYGAIRLWGSIGYAIMNVALGALVPVIGVNTSFYVLAAFTLPLLLLCFAAPDVAAAGSKKLSLRDMQIGRLFKNYYFVSYLFFIVLLNMGVTASYTFLPFLMEEMRVPVGLFGSVVGLRAMMQVPVLLLVASLRRRLSLPRIMLLASFMYMVEFFFYALLSGSAALFLLQALNGVAGGLMLGCGANYIYLLAPNELKATAQTVNGAVGALASITGSLVSGWLLDLVGVRSYYLMGACMILFAILFFLVSFMIGKKRSHDPSPLNVISV